jgi:predicted transcriptional regulator
MAYQGTAVIPGWLLEDDSTTLNAKMVYLALTTFIDSKSKECYPSHAALAARCGLSISSVQRALKELREKKIVTWKQRSRVGAGQTSNYYKLRLN